MDFSGGLRLTIRDCCRGGSRSLRFTDSGTETAAAPILDLWLGVEEKGRRRGCEYRAGTRKSGNWRHDKLAFSAARRVVRVIMMGATIECLSFCLEVEEISNAKPR